MKRLIFCCLTLTLLDSQIIYCQSTPERNISLDCRTEVDSLYETYSIDKTNLRYLIFSVEKSVSDDELNKYSGNALIILNELSKHSATEKKALAKYLLDRFKLNRLIFFENCKLVTLYFRALKHSAEERNILDNGVEHYQFQK